MTFYKFQTIQAFKAHRDSKARRIDWIGLIAMTALAVVGVTYPLLFPAKTDSPKKPPAKDGLTVITDGATISWAQATSLDSLTRKCTDGNIITTATGSLACINGSWERASPPEITSGLYEDAMQQAVAIWSDALGSKVGAPRLFEGYCHSDIALACADPERYIIIVAMGAPTEQHYDPTTVMLHEVAHLLGVPHIQGDELMDGNYQKRLEHPTAAAIALALLKKGAAK
jgi:hypothetical protein